MRGVDTPGTALPGNPRRACTWTPGDGATIAWPWAGGAPGRPRPYPVLALPFFRRASFSFLCQTFGSHISIEWAQKTPTTCVRGRPCARVCTLSIASERSRSGRHGQTKQHQHPAFLSLFRKIECTLPWRHTQQQQHRAETPRGLSLGICIKLCKVGCDVARDREGENFGPDGALGHASSLGPLGARTGPTDAGSSGDDDAKVAHGYPGEDLLRERALHELLLRERARRLLRTGNAQEHQMMSRVGQNRDTSGRSTGRVTVVSEKGRAPREGGDVPGGSVRGRCARRSGPCADGTSYLRWRCLPRLN